MFVLIVYKIVEGNSRGLADVASFVDLINGPRVKVRDLFDQESDVFVTRAPGRLDVMGGIADYSGSLVLPMPISEATLAAIQLTQDPSIRIISLHADSNRSSTFVMDIDDLDQDDKPREYDSVREKFSRDRANRWASYVAGVFYVLRRELGVKLPCGATILISSRVPVGKGVSSSAALEVSVMTAVCAAYDIDVEPRRLAILCQIVENKIVGAACGLMDQVAVTCGTENALLSMVCQPADIRDPIAIPDEIEFWGIDSGVRHSVAGSDYSSVRIGSFMGYRMIADIAGLSVTKVKGGLVAIDDQRWNGYLANVSPMEFENEFTGLIPDSVSGSEFLEKFVGTTDPVTSIDPAKAYAVRAPTEHAIYESARVNAFSELLADVADVESMALLGELMFQSHQSYKECGLTEARTDRIVELTRTFRDRGLFGARITGGGSGGTVVILAQKNRRDVVTELAERFRAETGQKPYIFYGSSPGCSTFGRLRVRTV